MLEIDAFERPHDYGEHFKSYYGPTIVARRNAEANGTEAEFDRAVDEFCDKWNLGTPERARFEQEYLITVGTRNAELGRGLDAPAVAGGVVAELVIGFEHHLAALAHARRLADRLHGDDRDAVIMKVVDQGADEVAVTKVPVVRRSGGGVRAGPPPAPRPSERSSAGARRARSRTPGGGGRSPRSPRCIRTGGCAADSAGGRRGLGGGADRERDQQRAEAGDGDRDLVHGPIVSPGCGRRQPPLV